MFRSDPVGSFSDGFYAVFFELPVSFHCLYCFIVLLSVFVCLFFLFLFLNLKRAVIMLSYSLQFGCYTCNFQLVSGMAYL